jgi:hypothetical protein
VSLGVKLELWPYGDERNAEPIGSIKISNLGTGNYERADYMFKVRDEDWNHAAQQTVPPAFGNISGMVRDHDRVHGGGWRLLYEVLKQVFEPED